jgi:hypothetical protein
MQGYVTLATGSRFYVEQAVNLALSLKLNDPGRPRCLITDRAESLSEAYRALFDEVLEIDDRRGFFGCLNKLRVQALSPFDETMYIDADCIVVKPDMDRHWMRLGGCAFGISGEKKTSGKWYGFEIADVVSTLGVDYVGVMNSGVFCFRSGADSAIFFDTALRLVESHGELLGATHRHELQLADEPFLGAALGLHQIEPVDYRPEEGSVMVTTYRTSGTAFDPFHGRSMMTKNSDFAVLGRFWPRRRVQHSPSIVHFVKLKPRAAYLAISHRLRSHFGVERYAF